MIAEAAAAGQPEPAVPRRPVHRDSSCATARGAATRWPTRRTQLGSPPALELHLRHMPGGKFTDHVFGAMKEKEILRIEGPFGSFFLREDSHKPIVLLAAGTGFAPIKALIEHMQLKAITRPARAVLGLPHARRPVPARLGAKPRPRRCRTCATCRCCRSSCRRRLDRPHRPRAPGRDGRPARPVRPPGLCLRRAGDGGIGAARLRRALRPAGRRVLRRRLHVRSRQARRPCSDRSTETDCRTAAAAC